MPDFTIRSTVGQGKNAEVNRGPVIIDATTEVAAAATAGTVYYLPPIPTNARVLGMSNISTDDLASTGSPTLDIGVYPVDAQFTADPDAINDGIDVFTAAVSNRAFVKDHANNGKRAWEYVAGLTADPGGLCRIGVLLTDAAANTGGTVTVVLAYSVA